MIHIRLFASFLTCVFAINCMAQSVEWNLSPEDFDDIQCIGKHIYLATNKDGKKTIIANLVDGKFMSKVKCDDITPFYKNWALMLKYEEKKKRVIGCIAADGICNMFEKPFYTLTGQEFYSEGLLTVENGHGEKVYIDYMGNEKIGTGKNYSRIKPFSEGFAVVFVNNNKESYYINKDGQSPQIRSSLLNNVTLGQVTNFYQGKALMMGTSKDYFICDINGEGEKLSQKPKDIAKSFDYLYRYIFNGGDVLKTPPYDPDYKGEENTIVKPIVEGKGNKSRYGYVLANGNTTVIPCQFLFAGPFVDGFAIVKMIEGKCGILQYSSESVAQFSVTPVQKTIQYDKPFEVVSCSFSVSPAQWHGHSIQAELADSKDMLVTTDGNGRFSFSFAPDGKHSKETFNINLLSNGIVLGSCSIIIEFQKKQPPKCSTCGADISQCPHQGKHSTCNTCNKIVDRGHRVAKNKRCPYDGGKHPDSKPKIRICPDCKKPIDECIYKGDHRIH